MDWLLGIVIYFSLGMAFLGCIGGPKARLQWNLVDGPIPFSVKFLIVIGWPFLLLLAILGGR